MEKTKEDLRDAEVHPQPDVFSRNDRVFHSLLNMGLVVEPVFEKTDEPDLAKLKRIKYFRVSTGLLEME